MDLDDRSADLEQASKALGTRRPVRARSRPTSNRACRLSRPLLDGATATALRHRRRAGASGAGRRRQGRGRRRRSGPRAQGRLPLRPHRHPRPVGAPLPAWPPGQSCPAPALPAPAKPAARPGPGAPLPSLRGAVPAPPSPPLGRSWDSYRWAGASPSTGFDCSGRPQWAWARGVGACRLVLGAVRRHSAHLARPAAARRPGVLQQPDLARRAVHRWWPDDPLAPHRRRGEDLADHPDGQARRAGRSPDPPDLIHPAWAVRSEPSGERPGATRRHPAPSARAPRSRSQGTAAPARAPRGRLSGFVDQVLGEHRVRQGGGDPTGCRRRVDLDADEVLAELATQNDSNRVGGTSLSPVKLGRVTQMSSESTRSRTAIRSASDSPRSAFRLAPPMGSDGWLSTGASISGSVAIARANPPVSTCPPPPPGAAVAFVALAGQRPPTSRWPGWSAARRPGTPSTRTPARATSPCRAARCRGPVRRTAPA